jgi:N-acetylglutamate synthase
MPDGHFHRVDDGIVSFVSGTPFPHLNPVMVLDVEADLARVRDCLHAVSATGYPYMLVGRPTATDAMASIAAECGMTAGASIPLMATTLDALGPASSPEPAPVLRVLGNEERPVHSAIMAAAFEAPIDLVATMIDLFAGLPRFQMSVAEVAGTAVATAVTFDTGPGSIGVFDVATLPDHRGRGLGTAVTSYAIEQARSADKEWVWLQSSDAGHPIYERMGFVDIERWPTWVGLDTNATHS